MFNRSFLLTIVSVLLLLSISTGVVDSSSISEDTYCGTYSGSGTGYSSSLITPTTPVAFTPLTNPSTVLAAGNDDTVDTISIGFSFTYYSYYYNSLYVSSNGNLQFTTYGSTTYNTYLFSSFPSTLRPSLCAFHTDLVLNSAVKYQLLGSSSIDRRLIIQYDSRYKYTNSNTGYDVKFEIQLWQSNNKIVIRYITAPTYSSQYINVGTVSGRTNTDYTIPYYSIINNRMPYSSNELGGKELTLTRSSYAPSDYRSCSVTPYYPSSNYTYSTYRFSPWGIFLITFGICFFIMFFAAIIRRQRARRLLAASAINAANVNTQYSQPGVQYIPQPIVYNPYNQPQQQQQQPPLGQYPGQAQQQPLQYPGQQQQQYAPQAQAQAHYAVPINNPTQVIYQPPMATVAPNQSAQNYLSQPLLQSQYPNSSAAAAPRQ